MARIDLAGLTNALTDITVNVREKDLRNLGVEKGSANSLNHLNHEEFVKILSKTELTYCQAGSAANVIFNASLLGLNTALLGSVGYDDIGDEYIEKLEKEEIKSFFSKSGGKSGICYILVTPDGERTNIVNIGAAGEFDPDFKELDKLETDIFHTSGYEVASNPEKAKEIIYCFKEKKTRVSFDLAADSMIRQQRKTIENIVEKTDILFATEEEAREFTNKAPFKALKELSKMCPVVALKRGSKGSVVRNKDEQYKIKAYPTKVINTCGAGDAYASGFLFAYIRGFSIRECGHMGSYIASRVCNSAESHLNRENEKI